MKFLLLATLLLLPVIAVSGTFSFAPPYYLECAGVIIDVDYYGAPCIVDWDGDGLKDLITGEFYYGNVRFYQNEGTNDSPVFNSFSYLEADGVIITMTYG